MRIHSYLSPKCTIHVSKIEGKGVFARENIKAGELIALWGGIILTGKEVDKICIKYPHFATHPVSVHENFYLGPTSYRDFDDAERFNHSCDANAGVKGQIVLVARRSIKKGEEIFFDYDTTETSNVGSFKCRCGAKLCRGLIDGSAWRKKDFQKRYYGFLSWYLEEKVKRLRSKKN